MSEIVKNSSPNKPKSSAKPKPKTKGAALVESPAALSTRKKNYTPQQVEFAMRYFLPDSPTYGNALQSALKAGYSQEYAESITIRNLDWMEKVLSEIVGKPEDKQSLINKAKKVLNKSLDSPDEKLAQDTAKFIAKSTPEFAEKQDITSNGETLRSVKVTLVNTAINHKEVKGEQAQKEPPQIAEITPPEGKKEGKRSEG